MIILQSNTNKTLPFDDEPKGLFKPVQNNYVRFCWSKNELKMLWVWY